MRTYIAHGFVLKCLLFCRILHRSCISWHQTFFFFFLASDNFKQVLSVSELTVSPNDWLISCCRNSWVNSWILSVPLRTVDTIFPKCHDLCAQIVFWHMHQDTLSLGINSVRWVTRVWGFSLLASWLQMRFHLLIFTSTIWSFAYCSCTPATLLSFNSLWFFSGFLSMF